jgi:selenocysteine lyase/cysteine desulfurase
VPASVDDALCDLAEALGRVAGPALVAVTGASNVTGEVWPVDTITALAHSYGARVVVDAAQLVAHRPVSLASSGVDYLAFSGHKMYAPFGVGVLAGRADWLDAAPPHLAGGGATATVDDDGGACWQVGPARHEAGTPNLLGAVALAAACGTLAGADRVALAAREHALLDRLRDGLADLDGVVELRTFARDHDRVGIVSFTVRGVASSDVSAALADRHGIGVRDGLFCAHPLTRHLLASTGSGSGLGSGSGDGTAVRASIGLGTTVEHVDRLIGAVRAIARG